MILKILLFLLLLYYIGVLWKYYRHDIAGLLGKLEGEDETEEADDEPEKTDEPYTVIGKSTYQNRQTDESEDKQRHAENQADKTDNFASGTPKAGTEQPEETTAPDDNADYSDIEVDPEEDEPEEEEYMPTPEEVEEEEELGAYYPDGNPDFATGYTFEDLKTVYRVMTTDTPDEEEKRQAREVLPAVMGSDIWDAMMDEFEGARRRVALLMNNSNV